MVQVTAHTFLDPMDLPTFDHEIAEKIIDLAVDCLNLYGQLDMSKMAGTAGSKTLSLTSPQEGAVLLVARGIYNRFYRDSSSTSVSSISMSSPSELINDTAFLALVREAARLLQEPDFSQAFLRS